MCSRFSEQQKRLNASLEWHHLSSYCWCVFTGFAGSEGLKINFSKTNHTGSLSLEEAVLPPARPLCEELCAAWPEASVSAQSFCSHSAEWSQQLRTSLLPSSHRQTHPVELMLGQTFPADVHPFLLCFSCCSAVPNFPLLPGPSEVISDGCAGAFSV